MSIPQIRTEAIEAVGRKILMEYDPSLLSGQPCPVPIETIIETKFDLILEHQQSRGQSIRLTLNYAMTFVGRNISVIRSNISCTGV